MGRQIYDTFFEGFKDGILILDKNKNCVYLNDSFARQSEIEKSDVLGRNLRELEGDSAFPYFKVLSHAISQSRRTEETIKLSSGKKLHATALVLKDEKGEVCNYLVGVIDFSNANFLQSTFVSEKAIDVITTEWEDQNYTFGSDAVEIIARSLNMKKSIETALQIAPYDTSVLITGESGTGKEIIADLIFENSERRKKPFVKINCSAIPHDLLESELFGYEEGAFTGAVKGGKPGIFEMANEGTLLLDEIGEMPLDLQAKLLRVLQTSEVMRLGGQKPKKLNVRVISSTNRNLSSAILDKQFREDLFYRINVVPISIDPLRKRREDIIPLIDVYLNKFNTKYSKDIRLTDEMLHWYEDYDWPGNVRELRNLIERLVVTGEGAMSDRNLYEAPDARSVIVSDIEKETVKDGTLSLPEQIAEFEKRIIKEALKNYPSKRKAAKALGIDDSTLVKKCKRYGI